MRCGTTAYFPLSFMIRTRYHFILTNATVLATNASAHEEYSLEHCSAAWALGPVQNIEAQDSAVANKKQTLVSPNIRRCTLVRLDGYM